MAALFALNLTAGAPGDTGSIKTINALATTQVAVIPTVTATTYAASVCMGGIQTITGILPVAPYGAVLESIELTFKGSIQTGGFWVAVFNTSPGGTFTDHTAAAIASGDSAYLLGMYHLTGGCSMLGTHTSLTLDGIGKAINGLSQNLYVVVVPDATTVALGSTSDMGITLGTLWG